LNQLYRQLNGRGVEAEASEDDEEEEEVVEAVVEEEPKKPMNARRWKWEVLDD